MEHGIGRRVALQAMVAAGLVGGRGARAQGVPAGDTPPIFAQAVGSNIVYAAASPSAEHAVLVPDHSPVKTLADLKGKRVAFGKGSSAHNAGQNRGELAAIASEATGIDLKSWQRAFQRAGFTLGPVTPAHVAQQQLADSFLALGIIPKKIAVAEAVWAGTDKRRGPAAPPTPARSGGAAAG